MNNQNNQSPQTTPNTQNTPITPTPPHTFLPRHGHYRNLRVYKVTDRNKTADEPNSNRPCSPPSSNSHKHKPKPNTGNQHTKI